MRFLPIFIFIILYETSCENTIESTPKPNRIKYIAGYWEAWLCQYTATDTPYRSMSLGSDQFSYSIGINSSGRYTIESIIYSESYSENYTEKGIFTLTDNVLRADPDEGDPWTSDISCTYNYEYSNEYPIKLGLQRSDGIQWDFDADGIFESAILYLWLEKQ